MRSPRKPRRGPTPPIPAQASRRSLPIAISVVLGGLTLALYAQVKGHAFLDFDDATYVVRNGAIRAGLTTASLFWAFTTSYAGNWHPLTWVSHMLDVQFHGMDAGWHHLSNLFIHVLTTLILFSVLARVTKSVGASAFVAALFALHPLHVESVAWVAERKDVMSGFWWVVTIGAYAAYARDQRVWRYGAVVGAFGLALLSKPMAVTLPFVLLLFDIWPLARWRAADIWPLARWRGLDGGVASAAALVREKIPLFLMAAASAVITFVAQRQAGAVQSFDAFPLVRRVANVPVAYVHYLFTTFWPVDLAVLYPYPASIPIWHAAIAAALLVIVTAWAWRAVQTRPYVLVGWLWFLGTLVPVIGIVQVGSQPYADRYMYIPAIGLFIIVAWEAARFTAARPALRPWLTAIGALIVLASAAVTYRQIAYWKNDVTLWERDVAVTVDNYRGHTNLGFALAQAGSRERALAAYREALRLNPQSPKTHNYLGLLLNEMGDRAGAASAFESALVLLPRFAEAHNNLGLTRMAQGRAAEGIAEFERAVQVNPAFGQAHNNLAIASAQQGNFDRAITEFEAAMRLQPGVAEPHVNLAAALTSAGRPREAIPHFEIAVRLDPNNADYHHDFGAALAQLGMIPQAIAEMRAAIRINPAHADAQQALRTLTGR